MDLDNNIVLVSEDEPLPELPEGPIRILRERLADVLFPELKELSEIEKRGPGKETQEEKEAKRDQRIRLCFLSYFVCLLRDIPKFINVELEDTDDVFDIEYYLNTQVTQNKVSRVLPFIPHLTLELQTYWEQLLKTFMFQIFTQKLANAEQAKTSLCLFLQLSQKIKPEDSFQKIFDIVMSHSFPSNGKRPNVIISMNNPHSANDGALYYWNPRNFPNLDCPNTIPDNTSALLDIRHALQSDKSPQLFLLQAHLQMQQYSFLKDRKYLRLAFDSVRHAMELNPLSVSYIYIYSLMDLFEDAELETLRVSKKGETILKIARDITENRKFSVRLYEHEDDEYLTEDEEEIPTPREEQFVDSPSPAHLRAMAATSMRTSSNPEFPHLLADASPQRANSLDDFKLRMCKVDMGEPNATKVIIQRVIISLIQLVIIPDDPVIISK